MKLYEIIERGYERLKENDVPDAKTDAELLWQYVSGMDKAAMLMGKNSVISEDIADRYFKVIEKRSSRYPLQYITGVQNFMGYDFEVSYGVLIPRQDTETLAEQALMILNENRQQTSMESGAHTVSVLDMCCGTGCIGLSLKLLRSDIELTLADYSYAAVSLAEKNAAKHNVDCDIIQTDLFRNIHGRYDMIVSNPPYIKSQVIRELMPEVRDYEPELALDGCKDGLLYYRRIIKNAGEYLKDGGYLLFEIGNDQAYEVLQLLVNGGFTKCRKEKDLSGNDRVVIAVK